MEAELKVPWEVGYGWLTTRPEWIGEVGLEIVPGPGEAYVWKCVTVPAYRRQGVFGRRQPGRQAALRVSPCWV